MIKPLYAITTICALAACGGSAASPASQGVILSAATAGSGVEGRSSTPIKHVVFIMQENRSFNNLFMGYPGATTASYGYDSRGRKVELHAENLSTGWDLNHSAAAFFADCDGDGKLPGTHCKMDGWNKKRESNDPPNAAYAYVPRKQIEPYWTMAQQYVLADRMFTSNLDASFVSHQYAVAAYASSSVDGPYADWGCEGGKSDTIQTLTQRRTEGKPIVVCFDNPTIADEADAAGVSWRFYASGVDDDGGIWSSYQADRKIFEGPDWSADVISPAPSFLTDVGRGKLAAITWITPPSWDSSDHAGLFGDKGPAWVTSLVNAIGESKFWNSTAIFVMWDDWGGWFDPVPPVYEDYDGLGFRVPLIAISPYARNGRVTHVRYETASVLRFIEDNFKLGQLAASDARANDPANDLDAFDFSQSPRKFSKIAGGKDASYWLRAQQTPRAQYWPSAEFGD
ncbi:MAG: alkaline phosphatase family protein [Candidatus Cybelea sp.]